MGTSLRSARLFLKKGVRLLLTATTYFLSPCNGVQSWRWYWLKHFYLFVFSHHGLRSCASYRRTQAVGYVEVGTVQFYRMKCEKSQTIISPLLFDISLPTQSRTVLWIPELRQAAVKPHSPGLPYEAVTTDDAGGAKGGRGQRETAQWRGEKQVSVFPPVLFITHLWFPDSSEHNSSLSVSPLPVKFPVLKMSPHPKKWHFTRFLLPDTPTAKETLVTFFNLCKCSVKHGVWQM